MGGQTDSQPAHSAERLAEENTKAAEKGSKEQGEEGRVAAREGKESKGE